MATTGAVVYINPRSEVTVAAGRRTGALLHIATRFVSGLYSETGVSPSTDQTNLKAWLPSRHIKVLNVDGTMSDPWYRFFHYLANIKLGGPNSATLPDIETTVTTAQSQAATVAATTAGLTQQVAQNAESLAATVEVAESNALAGATQIPRVQRTSGIQP